MGIEPKDIALLFAGWLITKMLDYMVKLISKSVKNNDKPKRSKSNKRKRRK